MHLDHTIVPAKDKVASAEFFARIMGLAFDGTQGHFAPVRVDDGLTMDFDNRDEFESHHYAFHITDAEFDAIFERVKEEGLTYGSGPGSHENMKINERRGGRGFYFEDPNGHLYEVLTVS